MALLLAASCADGGVRVFGAAAAALSSAPSSSGSSPRNGGDGGTSGDPGAAASRTQPPALLQPLGLVVPPDLRGVVSLAAACQPGPEGEQCHDGWKVAAVSVPTSPVCVTAGAGGLQGLRDWSALLMHASCVPMAPRPASC